MDAVIRGTVIYLFLLLIVRISGKRTLADVTTFDAALLLIISETVQEALINDNHSVTHAMLLIITLVVIDIGLSVAQQRWPKLDKWIDDVPLILVEHGRPFRERMNKCRVSDDDVLHAARELQGLERMEQIKYAILERSGGITVVPKDNASTPMRDSPNSESPTTNPASGTANAGGEPAGGATPSPAA